MRERVERAAADLGYHPNALASSLTTGRTKMIGLVSNNFHNPFFLEVFDLFTRGLQDRGLRPLLVNLTDVTDPQSSVRMLRAYSVDGVIVASSTLPQGFSRAFRDAGLPVVHSFGRYSQNPHVDIIGIDNIECGRMAARALLEREYKSVAFMGGPERATSTQDRLKGFYDALSGYSDVAVSHSFAEDYTFDAGRAEMQRLLRADPADAYFCGDDVLSIGALSAIADAGLSVPRDIGIVGLNDMEMARWENINLTTLHQPIAEIIEASIEKITNTLKGSDQEPEALLFPCHIVERGTLRKMP
jgi:DNA-binding LacI/PurR family transcriptional regulator